MKEKPRNPNAPFLDFSLKKWIFSVFLFNSLLVFFLYFFLLKLLGEKEIEKIRTILIVFSTFNSLTFIFSVKNFKKTIFSANLLENKYITLSVILGLILIILSIYHPWLNIILRTIPLKMKDLLFVFFLSVLELFVYEFFKKVFLIGWLSKNNNNKKI